MTTTATTRARPGLETWRNESKGTVWVRKLDRYGNLQDITKVAGGQVVHLSEEERRLNQDLIATADLDWFQNGTFTPVHILPEAADAAEVLSNPNVISDDELRALVTNTSKKAQERLDAKLAEIANPVTLDRLRVIAFEENAGVNYVRAIQDRIEAVGGAAVEANGDPVQTSGDGDVDFTPARPGGGRR